MSDAERERLVDGQEVVRTADGRFVAGGRLSSDRAREIGAKGGSTAPEHVRRRAKELGDAMASVLVDPDAPGSDALRLLLEALGQAAAKDSTASIRAIEAGLKLVGAEPKEARWDGVGICQTCKRGPIGGAEIHVSGEGVAHLLDLVRQLRVTGQLPELPDANLLDRISRAWVLGDTQAMDLAYQALRSTAAK